MVTAPDKPKVDVGSSFQDADGLLWVVDHRVTGETFALRPDGWGPRERTTKEATADELFTSWRWIESSGQRFDRLRRAPAIHCAFGRHEDPDNSGLCIHCATELDSSGPD